MTAKTQAKPKSESDDHRFAPRRKMKIPAFLYIDGVMTAVPCSIIDISTTGAKLELKAGWDNAFRFISDHATRVRLVERIEKVSYDCSIVRRAATELGLKFLAAPVLAPPPAPRKR